MLIFKLSILFTLGVILSTIMNKGRIPDVLAYITVGIILGPSFLNIFAHEDIESLNLVNQFATCMVGFLISKSLNMQALKKLNYSYVYMSIIESVVTFFIVFLVLFVVCSQSLEFSLILAAIASATAPLIPLMVLRQFKAKGNLTSAIVPVIAIDDIVCIVLFYITLAWAKTTINGEPFSTLIIAYSFMLVVSIVVGIVFGFVCSLLFNKLLKRADEHLIFSVGICFACVGIAQVFNLHPMLLAMTIGIVVANFTTDYEKIFEGFYRFAPPVFLTFFAATTSIIVLDINDIINIGILGIAYIISRTVGKLIGAYVGARIFKCSEVVKKYLGISILAQAGIILLMSDIVRIEIPQIGEQIYTIVRGGCIVFLVVGSLMTKFSIGKANEIDKER